MKKSALAILILIVLINFVSSQNLMSDFLNSLDESMVIFPAIFIISFAIVFFALSKLLFKQNQAIAGIIAGVIAFLLTYWANKTGFDFNGFFVDIGISGNILSTVLPIIIIGGIIFMIIKLGKNSLFVFSGLLLLLGFFVYAKVVLWVLAIILFVVRLLLKDKKDDFVLVKKRK